MMAPPAVVPAAPHPRIIRSGYKYYQSEVVRAFDGEVPARSALTPA